MSDASPPPTQTTPSSVSEIAAVADGRASEKPKTRKATHDGREDAADHPGDLPHLGAEQGQDQAHVPTEHERTEAAAHHVELVERDQPADERRGEEPPAAEPDDAEDHRQQDAAQTTMRDQKALIGRRTADRGAANAASAALRGRPRRSRARACR